MRCLHWRSCSVAKTVKLKLRQCIKIYQCINMSTKEIDTACDTIREALLMRHNNIFSQILVFEIFHFISRGWYCKTIFKAYSTWVWLAFLAFLFLYNLKDIFHNTSLFRYKSTRKNISLSAIFHSVIINTTTRHNKSYGMFNKLIRYSPAPSSCIVYGRSRWHREYV